MTIAGSPTHPLLAIAKRFLNVRFFRFLLTGGVNTIFGYSIFYLLLRLTQNTFVALTLGTILGVLFNFMSIGRVVFNSLDHRLLARFFLVYVVVYIYNGVGLFLLERRGVDPAIGGLLLLPGAVAISWLLNSRFVFRGAPARPPDA